MALTARELRDRLTELIEQEEIEPDAEIRIGHQPNWPLRQKLDGVVPNRYAIESEVLEEDRDLRERAAALDIEPEVGEMTNEEETEERLEKDGGNFAWIVVRDGSPGYDESPYAPRGLWDAVREIG